MNDEVQPIDWQAAVGRVKVKMEERNARIDDRRASLIGNGGVTEHVSLEQAHERRWERAIPARYRHARLEDLSGDLAEAKGWDGDSNVLLLGNVGAGKTHAAVALARVVHDAGGTVLFRSALALVDDLKPGGDEQAMDRALRADLLLLDDLGYERHTDFAADRVSRVITDRYDACRPTIVTSNLAPEALEAEVGPRLWSRLYHGSLRLKVAGSDRRKAA
jgi:DNA replication protein DnaC